MTPNLITTDHCPHVKRCGATRGQPHADMCPTMVLKLSDEDVDRFCSLFVESHPGPKGRKLLRGRYKGLHARALVAPGIDAELASRRWLVEDILIVAKERRL